MVENLRQNNLLTIFLSYSDYLSNCKFALAASVKMFLLKERIFKNHLNFKVIFYLSNKIKYYVSKKLLCRTLIRYNLTKSLFGVVTSLLSREVVLIDCKKGNKADDEYLRSIKFNASFRFTDSNNNTRNCWFNQQHKKVKHHFCLAAQWCFN